MGMAATSLAAGRALTKRHEDDDGGNGSYIILLGLQF